ncbi:vWA domain-containing protein [Pseudohaliea rubra]|uniref:TPR repeat containing protein n=1 Tax=Pseudohaliea rubra DSM 19751 TaxID=1265313 RepID=A0A095X052_9GAMM|nr:VWA domain-containing protein [Pseudohaliea rubra]KGE04259.1 TPR repeat containing protein [Pseudohaliea rubra DSM 19751]
MAEALAAFHFQRPLWLLALLLPLLGAWCLRRQRSGWASVVAPHLLVALQVSRQPRRRLLRPRASWLLALLLMPLALAGPSWQREPLPLGAPGEVLVVALHVGDSMLADDIAPSRLDRAVTKLRDLLEAVPEQRVGLVAYAGSAHTVMPPTADHGLLLEYAGALAPELMPRPGNDPVAALTTAARLARGAGGRGRLLLVSDSLPEVDAPALSFTVLAMVPSAARGGYPGGDGEYRAIGQAADTLGAPVVAVTIDDTDVAALARRLYGNGGGPRGEGERWADGGRYLLLPLLLLVAGWLRRGWSLEAD